jgi:hypothetical protein
VGAGDDDPGSEGRHEIEASGALNARVACAAVTNPGSRCESDAVPPL